MPMMLDINAAVCEHIYVRVKVVLYEAFRLFMVYLSRLTRIAVPRLHFIWALSLILKPFHSFLYVIRSLVINGLATY